MSQENVDVLKRGMECFERHDVEAAMELLDPEVEWHPAFTVLLGGKTTVFRGHDRAREVIRQFWEVFSETHFEVSEIRDLGDQALAIRTSHARGDSISAPLSAPRACIVPKQHRCFGRKAAPFREILRERCRRRTSRSCGR
jgi:ketosteroid isomerase-like protein